MWMQFVCRPYNFLQKYSWAWQQFYCSWESRVSVRVRRHWVLFVHWHCLLHTSGWLSYDCTGSLWDLLISVNIRWQGDQYFLEHYLLQTLLRMMLLQFVCRQNNFLQRYSWSWQQFYCSRDSWVMVRFRWHWVTVSTDTVCSIQVAEDHMDAQVPSDIY